MEKNQFESLSSVYDNTKHLVETVKVGDVMYSIGAKELLLNKFIQDLEVNIANTTSVNMKEWYQGKIEAYKMGLEILGDLASSVKNCK